MVNPDFTPPGSKPQAPPPGSGSKILPKYLPRRGLSLIFCRDLNPVFSKNKRYEVTKSQQISTKIFSSLNIIEGDFHAARIHDQYISWSETSAPSAYQPFNCVKISISCTCQYHERISNNVKEGDKKYCTHII